VLEIEPYLVEIIGKFFKKIRVPISSRQGLALANSSVSGTLYEEKGFGLFQTNSEDKPMVLGKGY
jgi:hypothetical protein